MSNTIKSIFCKLHELLDVQDSPDIDTDESVKWIPVLPCENNSYYMGISETGLWVIEGNGNVVLLNEPRKFKCVISILERPFDEVMAEIKTIEDNSNNAVDIVSIFPFLDIVRAGLEQGSDYWARLSFDWYDRLDTSKRVLLRGQIIDVKDSKWASQKVRQRSKRELKRMMQLRS